MCCENITNFTSSKIIGSLKMNVDITNDVDWLSERRQAIKDVREVCEERSGRFPYAQHILAYYWY